MYKNKLKNNINLSIIIFIVLFITFVYMKPNFLYTKNGCLRTFGLGKNNCSIFPIWFFFFLSCYFLFWRKFSFIFIKK